MIVCHCQGVSDRQVRDAVRDGARTLRQVARVCRAGRICGGCRPVICEILSSEANDTAPAALGHVEGLVGAG